MPTSYMTMSGDDVYMCYEISSANFLVNYFANHEKPSVSLSELKDLRKDIEGKLQNQVYIDLTYDSLAEAKEKIPSLRLSQGGMRFLITHCNTKEYYSEVLDSFNWNIPEEIRTSYLDSMSSSPS